MPGRKAIATAVASGLLVWMEQAALDPEARWAIVVALGLFLVTHMVTDCVAMLKRDEE